MTYIPSSLRQIVIERAHGRCEYCLLSEKESYWPHEIDHIYATKHGGETVQINLCLSCVDCNRYKGSDLCSLDPVSGEIARLFHPRRDRWEDHFRLEGARIVPLTAIGRVTERLLQFNTIERIFEREMLIALELYP